MIKKIRSDRMPRTTFALAALVAVLFLMSLWSALPVFAEEERPCAEDIANFCKDVRPGGGRIISCLKSHEVELSSVCRGKLQELQKRIDDAKRACKTDIEKFCKGIEEGEGRIARCLEGRGSELSRVCAEKFDLLKQKLKKESPPGPDKGGEREE